MADNFFSAFSKSIQDEQEQQRKLKQLFQAAMIRREAPSADEQIKQKLFDLASLQSQPRYGAGRIGPPTATDTAESDQRQSSIDTFLNILGRNRGAAQSGDLIVFDQDQGKYLDASGNEITHVKPRSFVRNKPKSTGLLKEEASARTAGAIEERGLSGESAGRLGSATQGNRLATTAQTLLFPDGTPQSFRRDLALKLQDPTGVSLVGDQEAQELEFSLGRALDAQRLAQTGVNFRPDELKRITRQFIANAAADPNAAFLRVNELSTNLGEIRSAIDPKNRFSGRAAQGQIQAFSSIEEAEAANLPPGTRITINGRPAVVD